jgi:hypothetical protein
MAIPSNLEDRITDPIDFYPFKNVQITNCKHRYSLSSALLCFGEMKNGLCSRQTVCPLCNQNVSKYEPDPAFQDLVDEILKSGQQLKPQEPSNLPVYMEATTYQMAPLKSKPEDESQLSDEEIARALQEELDREGAPSKTTKAPSPAIPAKPSQQQTSEKTIFRLQRSQHLEIPAHSHNCEIYGAMGSIIGVGSNSSWLRIYGNERNAIIIGTASSNIYIQTGVSNPVEIRDFCKDITIDLNTGSIVNIGNNCQDMHIYNACQSSCYSLGKNCSNIIFNGARVA